MSPEEWAFKISELIKEAEADCGWTVEAVAGDLKLTKWIGGAYEVVTVDW